MRPEEPLRWPPHFPSNRFFLGVRILGPDLSFFDELRSRQEQRSRAAMSAWPTWSRKRIAFLLGACVHRYIGWPKPYFLPDDAFAVVAYGPKYKDLDDLAFGTATLVFEEKLGAKLPEGFWDAACERTFGEVVARIG